MSARTVSAAPGQVPVQRVGGKKIGFVFPDPGTDALVTQGQDLLKETWSGVRQSWHDTKVGSLKVEVETAAAEMKAVRARESERAAYLEKQTKDPTSYPDSVDTKFPVVQKVKTKYGFSKFYADKLTSKRRNDQVGLLRQTQPFQDRRLKESTKAGKTTIQYSPTASAPYVDVAELRISDAAFKRKQFNRTPDPNVVRDVHSKYGIKTSFNNPSEKKQYVRDDRQVLTRRFAYVEKNYYQMMEFFMTGHMEGRFTSFMKAAGQAKPDLYEHRDPGVDMVVPGSTPNTADPLTVEQMAVAHQKLGSGPQQRGVSLTATPKVNATYVNTGENFRTDRGFRLKVDLARIQPSDKGGPLLINHYSDKGVIDAAKDSGGQALYDTRRERNTKGDYPYKESSIHARELLLEFLKPEWVVAIEYHDQGNKSGSGTGSTMIDAATPMGTSGSMFSLAKQRFGGDRYQQGFDFGLANSAITNSTDNADTDYKAGFDGGRLFIDGWTRGSTDFRAKTLSVQNGERGARTWPQYVHDEMQSHADLADKFDLFKYGYLRGRAGKPMITDHADLKQLSA